MFVTQHISDVLSDIAHPIANLHQAANILIKFAVSLFPFFSVENVSREKRSISVLMLEFNRQINEQ